MKKKYIISTGMISGIVAMSGSPLSAFAVDPAPKQTYQNMTTLLGCDQSVPLEAIRCLQMLSIQTIINSDFKYQVGEHFFLIYKCTFILYLLLRIQN